MKIFKKKTTNPISKEEFMDSIDDNLKTLCNTINVDISTTKSINNMYSISVSGYTISNASFKFTVYIEFNNKIDCLLTHHFDPDNAIKHKITVYNTQLSCFRNASKAAFDISSWIYHRVIDNMSERKYV